MGLDLFLYRLTQINPKSKRKITQNDSGVGYVLASDAKDFVLGEKWLKKTYLGQFNDAKWNQERFEKKYGKKKFEISCIEYGGKGSVEFVVLDDKDDETNERITVMAKEYNSYFDDNWIPCYYYMISEITYQRKGIDNDGWVILMKIGNCVNCKDKKIVRELTKHGLSEDFINMWVKDCVFYAWW